MNRVGNTPSGLHDPLSVRQQHVLDRLVSFYGPCPLVGKIFRRYLRRCQQLLQQPVKPAYQRRCMDRGQRSEHKVALVLQYLLDRELIETFQQTAPATPGADFYVVTTDGATVLIEVKSSPGAIRKHYKTYLSKGTGGHPVNGRLCKKRVFQQVLRVINR